MARKRKQAKKTDPDSLAFLGQTITMNQSVFLLLTEMQIVWLLNVIRNRDGLDSLMQAQVLAVLQSALKGRTLREGEEDG